MKPKKRLLLSLLIMMALAQCSVVLHAGERYYSADKGFSLQFPAGWVVEEHFMGTEVAAYLPDPATRLTVNVVTEDLPGEITLDEYFDVSVSIGSMFENFVEYERGQATLNGIPARWLLYSYGSGQVSFKALAYLMVSGNTGFVLTCGSIPETFAQNRPVLEQIAGTFRLEARGQNESQAPRSTLPEITVRTPEPAPRGTAAAANVSAHAPAEKPFTIGLEQDGQPIQVVDHTARLGKKPFALVITFRAPDSVLVNASANPQSYEAARAGTPLERIAGFGSAGLIEGARNTEQEVILSDTDYQYWFYSTPSVNRFDKTREEGGSIVCRRTIARIFSPTNRNPCRSSISPATHYIWS